MFWDELKARRIPVTLVKVPMDYPPAADAEDALAGLGVPDMQGTFGTFTFFTDDPLATASEVAGGRIERVKIENHGVKLRLTGPPNSFRSDGRLSAIEIDANIDPAQPVARFRIGRQAFILRQGEWLNCLAYAPPL